MDRQILDRWKMAGQVEGMQIMMGTRAGEAVGHTKG
jgi:hypothetical protein